MSKMARAQATTESPRVFSTILRAVVERMEGQTCLDRDMLFQDTNNQEHIQALLFARTSPLLMLRALPMAAFDLYSSEKGEAFSTDAYALSIDDSDDLLLCLPAFSSREMTLRRSTTNLKKTSEAFHRRRPCT